MMWPDFRGNNREIPVWDLGEGNPVAAIVLSPAGLDFLINYLPSNDEFTKSLMLLRSEAQTALWISNA